MSARKVLLINPRMASPRGMRLPLSLLHLGAVLEGKWPYQIIDGNVDPIATCAAVDAVLGGDVALMGVTVMPGPQVAPAIETSRAVRAAQPGVPIAWGGYFPSMYTEAALNAPYVDYAVRGQGEGTLLELLERLDEAGPPTAGSSAARLDALRGMSGLSWRVDGQPAHAPERPLIEPNELPSLPYDRVGEVGRYMRPSFMGARTAVHQAAVGCRFRCTFCGVASVYGGGTRFQSPSRVAEAMRTLRDRHGATAIQFYDNNFFDREAVVAPILEAMATAPMPWWCYARADALAGYSAATWALIKRSKLRMAYIGAESASDDALQGMRKGTRVEQTLEAAARCRENGVIPEFSFILGGPEDPEGEIENTFRFVKRLKRVHPECEIILYFYSPTPQRDPHSASSGLPSLLSYGPGGPELPATPEEWTEPRWIDYVCHRDAPWLTERTRERVKGFARVLQCRFPTVQDYRTPGWGKSVLAGMARWRYSSGRYDRPWELNAARKLIPLREPQKESL